MLNLFLVSKNNQSKRIQNISRQGLKQLVSGGQPKLSTTCDNQGNNCSEPVLDC
jgi:hypothetical protein